MKLKIVTPIGRIFEGDNVEKLTIPTESGVITILEDHMPLISIVSPGEVLIHDTEETITALAISKGVLEVRETGEIFVLAETAEHADEIDIDRAEEAKKAAEEFLKTKHDIEDVDFAKMQAQLEKELARIEVGRKWKRLRR
ncbi:MAG: hypothetical protein Kow0081_1170 [Candidatus Dojkabacteria bacterium]